MERLPKYIKGLEVKKIGEYSELRTELIGIINGSLYHGDADPEEIEHAYLSCPGEMMCLFNDDGLAAVAKMLQLPETDTAYFVLFAYDPKYRGTGLFSSSLPLSIGQGLEWGSRQVACATANNRVLEIFSKLGFTYDSKVPDDRLLMQAIAFERFGPDAELMDGFILDGRRLSSYPNVPCHEVARSKIINRLFGPPFERDRCDRRLMFKRLDKKAETEYGEWLATVEQ